MRGKNFATSYVKDGLEVGMHTAEKAARFVEKIPVARRAVALGRYLLYATGTQIIFDKVVTDDREEMKRQIRGDMLAVTMRAVALRESPKETLAELDALGKFVDLYGPRNYEELRQVEEAENKPPEEFPARQLMNIMNEAEKHQRSR